MEPGSTIRLPALEIAQGENRRLYSFAIDGKLLSSIVSISRIKRSESGDILGYQRPAVSAHIAEIRAYIESPDAMVPNALVVAFDDRVRFEPDRHGDHSLSYSRTGTLVVPFDPSAPEADRPGWVVDGQQRLTAIREASIDSFPICVVSFVAADDVEQREQFILVNSTKPLPKGLIYELLPTTGARLPSLLERRRLPSYLLSRLNADANSPLRGMISTPTNPGGVIKDNSLLRMLEHSIVDGSLYLYRDSKGAADVEAMLIRLQDFWNAVAATFQDAWGLPPKRSRLLHGAGVISLGFLMDAISDRHRDPPPSQADFEKALVPLRTICRWTHGYWDLGPGIQRRWNEIQNTPKDIQMLTNYLLIQYRSLSISA